MQTIQIPLVGSESVSGSPAFNAQKTVNFVPVVDPESSYGSALIGRPGLTKKVTIGGIGYGLFVWNDHIYGVWGDTVYKVSSNHVATSMGTMSGTPSFASFGASSSQLAIARTGDMRVCDGSTLVGGGGYDAVTFLNQKFITSASQNTFYVSDLLDATTYNGFNNADAESNFDPLLRPFAFKEMAYMFGSKTIEPWYDSGAGLPPLDRVTGGLFNIGTAASASVASNDDYIYFLGDDRSVYRIAGTNHQEVSTPNISYQLSALTTVSDAKGYCFRHQGRKFYFLQFPTEDVTYVYCETTNTWAQWSSNYGRFHGNDVVYAWGKTYVQGHTGNLYELTGVDDDGDEIIRMRRGIHLHSGMIAPNMGGRRVFLSGLKLVMQSGNGAVTGQGVTPEILLRISEDGGRTWGGGVTGTTGVLGDYDFQVEWFGLGASFYDGQLELTCSDPVDWNLFQLHADIEIGIR